MIKAIKITAIIYNIVLIFAILLFIGFGIGFIALSSNDKMITDTAEKFFKDQAIEDAKLAAKVFLITMGIIYIFASFLFVAGLIFNIVIKRMANKNFEGSSKGKIIAFGVLGIVFGANVPGVLTIIYGATHGNKSNGEEVAE